MRTREQERARYAWMTLDEAALELGGVSVTHVMRLVEDGDLRARNVARRGAKRPSWRIDPETVERFNTSRTTP